MGRVGGLFEVVDPTFGHPKFLSAEAINAEASGVFIVPASQIRPGWRALSASEASQVYGRGNSNMQGDGDNQPCDCPPPCPPGTGGSGSGPDMADCPDCGGDVMGMPFWRLHEPYINLWLFDRPLAYQAALGQRLSLVMSYKQRDESVNGSSGVFNFGNGWNCNWLSYVQTISGTNATNAVNLYLPGGGVSYFQFGANGKATNYYNNFRLDYYIQEQSFMWYRLLKPDGAQIFYEFFRTDSGGSWYEVYMTRTVDPNGNTT